jgi:hypothetical protein
MTIKTLSAGEITDAYCTSCRTVMNHTIVSMIEARPARVQCNTCSGVHNYRKEKTAKKAPKDATAKTPVRRSRKDPGEEARQEWVVKQANFNTSKAFPYDMKAIYQVGNLVSHPKFGMGLVKQMAGPRKVEILFEEGLKLLRCG